MRREALLVLIIWGLSLFVPINSFAGAGKMVVTGKVVIKGGQGPVSGAMVYLVANDAVMTVTDDKGTFELTVNSPGDYKLSAFMIGFDKPEPKTVSVGDGLTTAPVFFYMEPVQKLTEIVISADRNPDKIGKLTISGKELYSVPGSGGDPIRGMIALPGITLASDTAANPAIRGSGPNDNVYYIDFLPAAYIFHMGGRISVINPDLVDNFNLYLSAFGPEFFDATGAVIDVKLRNPRTDRLGGKISASLLEADFLLEGPVTDNQSFFLTARRSYIDLFLPKTGQLESGIDYRQFPQFYDYMGKYVWDVNPDNRFYVLLNGASDEMVINIKEDSNAAANDPLLAGEYSNKQKFHSQGAVLESSLAPGVTNRLGVDFMSQSSKERPENLGHANIDWATYLVREHLSFKATPSHEVMIGGDADYSTIALNLDIANQFPSDFDPDLDYTGAQRKVYKKTIRTASYAMFVKDRWRLADPLTVILGARYFHVNYLDETAVSPRASLEYTLPDKTLVTFGWGTYRQFPEGQQVVEEFGNPDLEMIAAEHFTLGASKELNENWSVKAETYYKTFDKLITPDSEKNFLNNGSGKAYGIEVLVKKNLVSELSGWLSVAYAKSERKNDVTGETFPYAYDQPVIVNLVVAYQLPHRWSVSGRWRYQTGAPFTPVTGTYTSADGRVRPIYDQLGSERLPDYHRLDLRVDKEHLFDKWKMGTFMEIINAYARQNIAGYQYTKDYADREPVYQLSLLVSFGIKAEF